MDKIHRVHAAFEDDALPVYHGGDLAAARRLFRGAPEPWIDLSTGVNPEPYPIPPLSADVFTRLPGTDALERLEDLAAHRYGAPANAAVIAAPGTQAIIQLLPRLVAAKRIGILGFTYGEYAKVWRDEGLVPEIVQDFEALRAFDVAMIVNPNNPDGRLVPAEDLVTLAYHLARKGGLLVVDEAFVDLLPADASLVPNLPLAGTLVLRSFGKTYGLPGVRLGFAVTNKNLGATLRRLLGPWAVSGPAIAIGEAALKDTAWFESLSQRLAPRGKIVEAALAQCGAERIGGTPLFQLFEHRDAERLFAAFGQEGILLRRFPERPQWLRAGLVAPAFEERLTAAAARIAKEFS